jgi:hypothetical protein
MQDTGRSNHNHVNTNVRGIRQEETRHRKCKRLKLGDGQAYGRSADQLQFQSSYIRHNLLHKPALAGNLCVLSTLCKCYLVLCSDQGCTESIMTWTPWQRGYTRAEITVQET